VPQYLLLLLPLLLGACLMMLWRAAFNWQHSMTSP
jgi:hypothetical protein